MFRRKYNKMAIQKFNKIVNQIQRGISKWGRIKSLQLLVEICSQCFHLPTVFGAGCLDHTTSTLISRPNKYLRHHVATFFDFCGTLFPPPLFCVLIHQNIIKTLWKNHPIKNLRPKKWVLAFSKLFFEKSSKILRNRKSKILLILFASKCLKTHARQNF